MAETNDRYKSIQSHLRSYLETNAISKVACFTNCPPNTGDARYLLSNFNYIRFCVPHFIDKVEYLVMKYKAGYKKISFDISVSNIEECITKRQFGYVCLKFRDLQRAQAIVVKRPSKSSFQTESVRLPTLIRCNNLADIQFFSI